MAIPDALNFMRKLENLNRKEGNIRLADSYHYAIEVLWSGKDEADTEVVDLAPAIADLIENFTFTDVGTKEDYYSAINILFRRKVRMVKFAFVIDKLKDSVRLGKGHVPEYINEEYKAAIQVLAGNPNINKGRYKNFARVINDIKVVISLYSPPENNVMKNNIRVLYAAIEELKSEVPHTYTLERIREAVVKKIPYPNMIDSIMCSIEQTAADKAAIKDTEIIKAMSEIHIEGYRIFLIMDLLEKPEVTV